MKRFTTKTVVIFTSLPFATNVNGKYKILTSIALVTECYYFKNIYSYADK